MPQQVHCSRFVTGALSVPGKLLIALLMFLGRVGPMALALMVGNRDASQRIRLPEEEVVVG